MSVNGKFPDFGGETDATDVRLQCAALCYRQHRGQAQVLLITSRDTGRWLLPKGWPIAGLDLPQSAAYEAWEEAGVKGEALDQCLGHYSYLKTFANRAGQPCTVAVYPLRVEIVAAAFRERQQRRRRWFALAKAAKLVQEPEAQRLIAEFADNPLVKPPGKPPGKRQVRTGAAKA